MNLLYKQIFGHAQNHYENNFEMIKNNEEYSIETFKKVWNANLENYSIFTSFQQRVQNEKKFFILK